MTVVFKLGGSLLTLPDLPSRLRSVVGHRANKNCLVVVGGGTSADLVREWSHVFKLDEETAHWLAISSLDLNRQLLESLLSWKSITKREEAQSAWQTTSLPLLLNLGRFLKAEEVLGGETIPHTWDVTSDSLAAWGTICWPATELILLKSTSIERGLSAREACNQLLVDPFFPQLSGRIRQISWCNLRSDPIVIEPWLMSNFR